MREKLREEQRRGVVYVTHKQFNDHIDSIMDLLGQGIIYDCDYEYARQCFVYCVFHADLEVVEYGNANPQYRLDVENVIGDYTNLRFCEY